MDEMIITATEMSYYALLAELFQDKIDNCEVGLVGAEWGDGLNHIS